MPTRFSHEKLDVYRASLEFVTWSGRLVADLSRAHRHVRDQLSRSAMSIPLNIAEGNGKGAIEERKRYFEIARGSATESAATLDVLVALGACSEEQVREGKELLDRIVAMLMKMAPPSERRAREDEELYRLPAGRVKARHGREPKRRRR